MKRRSRIIRKNNKTYILKRRNKKIIAKRSETKINLIQYEENKAIHFYGKKHKN